MKRCQSITLLSLTVLAGCQTLLPTREGLHQDIATEMKKAVASRETVKNLLPPLKVEAPLPPPRSEPRFDLVMSNVPASQVFMALVAGTHYSMMMDPDLSGTISVNLKNVTVREVLKALQDLYHYDYEINGNIIRVHSNSIQSRIFQINYLAAQRLGSSSLRVAGTSLTPATPNTGAAGSPGSGTPPPSPSPAGTPPGSPTSPQSSVSSDNSRVTTKSDTDIWRDLEAALAIMIGNKEGRSFVINSQSGVVLVQAMPNELRKVENYLRSTQLMIERQVMLEAKIIDVTLSEEFQSGINWASFYGTNSNGATRSTLGVVTPGSAMQPVGTLSTPNSSIVPGLRGVVSAKDIGKGFLGMAFQTANFATVLNFLEGQGSAQVLSSPRVSTLNNQKAVLKVGVDDFYVTSIKANVAAGANGAAPVVTPEVTLASFFSGIALDVTPQIDEKGIITLHIHPTVSTVVEKTKLLNLGTQMGQLSLPLASSSATETDSMVRVRNGQIVAIGGLMRSAQNEDRSGLPGTTESGFGILFGSRGNKREKRELVILIKPTVVNVEEDWQQDLTETQSRLEQYAVPR